MNIPIWGNRYLQDPQQYKYPNDINILCVGTWIAIGTVEQYFPGVQRQRNRLYKKRRKRIKWVDRRKPIFSRKGGIPTGNATRVPNSDGIGFQLPTIMT